MMIQTLVTLLGCSGMVLGAVGIDHVTDVGTNGFEILQVFDGANYTGFLFNFSSGNSYQYLGSYLDEGVDLFLVQEGDAFAPGSISTGGFQEFFAGENYVLPPVFFVGLETPSQHGVLNPPMPPAYGWVKFGNENGVLTLLDHAIDYDGNGLFVGTTTIVPEPSQLTLTAIGVVSLLTCRRRK